MEQILFSVLKIPVSKTDTATWRQHGSSLEMGSPQVNDTPCSLVDSSRKPFLGMKKDTPPSTSSYHTPLFHRSRLPWAGECQSNAVREKQGFSPQLSHTGGPEEQTQSLNGVPSQQAPHLPQHFWKLRHCVQCPHTPVTKPQEMVFFHNYHLTQMKQDTTALGATDPGHQHRSRLAALTFSTSKQKQRTESNSLSSSSLTSWRTLPCRVNVSDTDGAS